jgi:Skp family chaperone for outer membrane proteins
MLEQGTPCHMKQRTPTLILLFILSLMLFTGCSKEPLPPQAVVINLGTVSQATGINEQMKQQLQTLNQQFSAEMKQLSEELGKEIEAEKTRLGDSPSAEDEKTLQSLQQQLSKRLMNARSESNAKLAKQRSEITQAFIDSIMLVAQQIAAEQGASIVLKANGVFWTDGTVDITDEVIARMPGRTDSEPADNEKTGAEDQSSGE